MKILFPLIFLFALTLSACITETITPLPHLPTATQITEASAQIDLYFSNPDDPTAGSYRGGPDEALADAIRNAEFSVDAAIYHLNLWSIRDALIAAHDVRRKDPCSC